MHVLPTHREYSFEKKNPFREKLFGEDSSVTWRSTGSRFESSQRQHSGARVARMCGKLYWELTAGVALRVKYLLGVAQADIDSIVFSTDNRPLRPISTLLRDILFCNRSVHLRLLYIRYSKHSLQLSIRLNLTITLFLHVHPSSGNMVRLRELRKNVFRNEHTRKWNLLQIQAIMYFICTRLTASSGNAHLYLPNCSRPQSHLEFLYL